METWILFGQSGSKKKVFGVFSTEEKAEAVIETLKNTEEYGKYNFLAEKYQLDECVVSDFKKKSLKLGCLGFSFEASVSKESKDFLD